MKQINIAHIAIISISAAFEIRSAINVVDINVITNSIIPIKNSLLSRWYLPELASNFISLSSIMII